MHYIWQNQRMSPDKVLNIAENDVDFDRVQAFIFASTQYALEEGDSPLKVRHFTKKEEK